MIFEFAILIGDIDWRVTLCHAVDDFVPARVLLHIFSFDFELDRILRILFLKHVVYQAGQLHISLHLIAL